MGSPNSLLDYPIDTGDDPPGRVLMKLLRALAFASTVAGTQTIATLLLVYVVSLRAAVVNASYAGPALFGLLLVSGTGGAALASTATRIARRYLTYGWLSAIGFGVAGEYISLWLPPGLWRLVPAAVGSFLVTFGAAIWYSAYDPQPESKGQA